MITQATVIACVSLGIFFLFVAAIGAVRLPDFYTRSHALGVTDTLGTLLILLGLMISSGWTQVSGKLFLIFIFVYLINPTVTHVLFRAALRSGLKPWTKADKNGD